MVLPIADALAAYRQGGGLSSSAAATTTTGGTGSSSFGSMVKDYLNDATNTLQEGEKAATASALGKGDLTTVITAISKAELMLQTVVTIRDKVIAAYQDITKTAI